MRPGEESQEEGIEEGRVRVGDASHRPGLAPPVPFLVRTYGFTLAEGGFITNFDIKYRLGQAAPDGEEDE